MKHPSIRSTGAKPRHQQSRARKERKESQNWARRCPPVGGQRRGEQKTEMKKANDFSCRISSVIDVVELLASKRQSQIIHLLC
mmetsp:Transcript_10365/g.15513  ORF Transcript_10365/g.15513 Transcript_10365/m.15513 type:complete len:83 (-) Transcript_10365:52-300(-)